MFWSGSSRQRKAVLLALSAVGETGMTLLALGLAVNLPEGRLHTILEGLVRSGQVRRRGNSSSPVPGPRTAQYHLASGRHSGAVPGIPPHRTPPERPGTAELPRPESSVREGKATTDRPTALPLSRRAGAVPTARMRSSRAHGV